MPIISGPLHSVKIMGIIVTDCIQLIANEATRIDARMFVQTSGG